MPKSELIEARELVHKFEMQLQVLYKNIIEQEKANSICEIQPKRQQGWP